MSATTDNINVLDARYFRDVLGNVPTSVVAITALDDAGKPAGMSVGTFTSVSLDPPLVAFLPDKSSTTFPKIQAAGRFTANILTQNQEHICRELARKGEDKFAALDWHVSDWGTPHIADAAGWIDCTISDIHEAGDHYIAVGRVQSLRANGDPSPLIFFRGGFGRFASSSLAAPGEAALYHRLRVAEIARPVLQALSDELGVECLASTTVGDQLVVIGSTEAGGTGVSAAPRLGQRTPFSSPIAAPLVAWADDQAVASWIARAGGRVTEGASRELLARVRQRGWSVVTRNDAQDRFERAIAALAVREAAPEAAAELKAAAAALSLENYEPDQLSMSEPHSVRYISAPVFEPGGNVSVVVSIYRPPRALTGADIALLGSRVVEASAHISDRLRGAADPTPI